MSCGIGCYDEFGTTCAECVRRDPYLALQRQEALKKAAEKIFSLKSGKRCKMARRKK